MDRIGQLKGMFAVKYNHDISSCPAIIDSSEGERREGEENPQRGGGVLYTRLANPY